MAQGARVSGTVRDSTTRTPVPYAIVRLVGSPGVTLTLAQSDSAGAFTFPATADHARSVMVARIGYQARTVSLPAEPGSVNIMLVRLPAQLNRVEVTASRQAETGLVAPAATSVVTREEMATRAAPTIAEYVRGLPGLDVAGGGVMQSNMVARGFNGLFSGELLMLVDHRYAFVPSLRVNVASLLAPAPEDIERIELVLGPGSALYGPNTASGVLQVITRSPLTSQGTQLSLEGGERSYMRASARHAWLVTPALGVKLSGTYTRVRDFMERDTVEEALIAARGGAPRDYDNARYSAEARADWAPGGDTRFTATVGRATLLRALEPTGEAGAVQAKNWSVMSYQLRGESGRLNGTVFYNQNDAGQTMPLRTGQPLVDRSSQLVVQLQHGIALGGLGSLRYGLDLIRTNPVTDSTIDGRNENRDQVDERGIYALAEHPLGAHVDLSVAAREDWHSALRSPVFSPRVALVWKPSATQSLRITYNRAYTTPTNFEFFSDQPVQPLDPRLPYNIRLVGVPDGGFQFRRDCAGGFGNLCMRSPFAPGSGFMATNAAALWGAAVNALGPSLPAAAAALLPLLRSLAPTSADLGTRVARLNLGRGTFDPLAPTAVTDFAPLQPTRSSVFEVGYKALVGGRTTISVALWKQQKHDFIFLAPVTPNVFFDAPSLGAYLTQAFTRAGVPNAGAVAAQLATGFAAVPLGTVQPDHPLVGPNDIVLSYRNAGEVNVWGLDVGGETEVGAHTIAFSYSYLDRNLFSPSAIDGVNEVPLNAPRHKASISLRSTDVRHRASSEVRVRYVDAFPAHAGVFQRDVAAYTVVDAGLTWRPSVDTDMTWSLTASNLFDLRHYEFAGTPRLGRLLLTKVAYGF